MFTGRTFWGWLTETTFIAWERGFVIAAVLASVLGMALLEQLLHEVKTVVLARLAFVTYFVAAIVLIGAEAAFIDGRPFVSSQLILVVVLACLGQAVFGLALVRSPLVAPWAGWTTSVWNLGALVVLVLFSPQNMYYPAIHFVGPLIIGIALLAHRRTARSRATEPESR